MLFYNTNFLQIFFIICISTCTTIRAEGEDSKISIVNSFEEIQKMREEYGKLQRVYIDERIKEINTLLNGTSNRWDFINDMNTIQSWWSIDMNERQSMILSKLPKLVHDSKTDEEFFKAFGQVKDEFSKNLEWAGKFWHDEADKKLKPMRDNPNRYHGLIREPVFTTEHPYLNLPPEYQPLYNNQMRNLTHIATLTKEIIRSKISSIVPIKLPAKDDISYFSLKTKFEMISQLLQKNQHLLIDSSRIFSTERVSGAWRIQNKNGPTQEEFDKEYMALSRYATNLIKTLPETVNLSYSEFI